MLLFAAVSAQTVSVTFTGRDAQNHYFPLSRVVVSNLSKGWQETLTWPDTVLGMTATGIGDVETRLIASLQLSQNNPNPFDGTTFVNLNVAEQGDVELLLTDIAGRIVGANNYSPLQPGTHSLRITLSSPGLYFLTARQNDHTASVKMVNRGNGGGNAIAVSDIVWANYDSPIPQPKHAHRGETDNPFDFGDQMEYVGFADFNGRVIVSGHVLQVLDASQTVVLTFEDGLPCSDMPMVTDREGNVYATVQIGQQCWMRDNLRTTTSPTTGTYLIPAVNTEYTYTGKQARWYNNDSATYAPMNYGLLYNWNAAMDTFNTAYGETSVNTDVNNAVSVVFSGNRRGICPAGWHLPSDAEWFQLTDYVSNQRDFACDDNSDNIAKALASTTGWSNGVFCDDFCDVGYDPSTNNTLGFGAVPAGYYWSLGFTGTSHGAFLWSSTESETLSTDVFIRRLLYYYPSVYWGTSDKSDGISVRCLRD